MSFCFYLELGYILTLVSFILTLNFPIYLFIANKKLKNIKLILEKDKSEPEEFNLEQDKNNVIYLINNKDLNNISRYSLNFSIMDKAYLHYDCQDEEGLKMIAIVSQVSRMMNGMCGLSFSK